MQEIVQYINETFGIDNNTTAPILITLVTFILSYIIVWLGQLYKDYKEAAKIRAVFEVAVNRLIVQMKNQSKVFTATSNNLVFKNDMGFSFGRVQLLPINTFENVGYTKTIEIYILRVRFVNPFNRRRRTKRAKAINKLWEVIHSVNYWHEKAINDTIIFQDTYNKYNDRRNDAVEEHNKFFLEMLDSVMHKQLTPDMSDYIEKVVQIREAWEKLVEKTQPDILNEYFIQSLRRLNREQVNNPFARGMSPYLLRADHEFTNQNNVLEFYRKQYQDYSIIFRNYSRIADKCIRMLKDPC